VNKSNFSTTARGVKWLCIESSHAWELLSLCSYRVARGVAPEANEESALAILSPHLPLDELPNLKRALRAAFLTIFDGWTLSMAASTKPLAGEGARHIVSTNWL
jgi:hypothetical protein